MTEFKQYRLFNGNEVVELVDMPNSDASHVVRRLNAVVAQPVHPDQLSLPSALDLQAHGVLSNIDEGDYVVDRSDSNPTVFQVLDYVENWQQDEDGVFGSDGTMYYLSQVQLASPRQLKEAGIVEDVPKKPLTFD